MYNKKCKITAILAVVTAVLLVGFMILLPFLLNNADLEGLGEAIALIFAIIYGLFPLYAGALPFAIVGLTLGIKMLKEQSRAKLISFNKRMLITSCVLLPLLAWGMTSFSGLISSTTLGLFPVVYSVVAAVAYAAGLITQIVTLILLKKSPEESAPTVAEE